MESSSVPAVGDGPTAGDGPTPEDGPTGEDGAAAGDGSGGGRSAPRRPLLMGRTGTVKTPGEVVRILFRVLHEDVVNAFRHYYFDRFAGAWFIPRPLRFLLYRAGGVRLEQCDVAPGVTVAGTSSNLSIGHGSSVNVGCFFDCMGRITLGRNVMVAMGVMIVTSDHPLDPDGRPQGQPVGRDVVIGDRVWLGARATVLPGVTIGEGAIVSAGAVVTRDCRPYSVYAGVPARMVGTLPGAPVS